MSASVYEKGVKDASKNNIDRRFPNSSVAHARLLIKEIINNSNKELWLLSSTFYEPFYRGLEANFRTFLSDKTHKINVIVSENSTGLIDKLKNDFSDNFIVSKIKKSAFPKDKESKNIVNYIVNDTNAYRYEYNETEIDEGIVQAIANFNNEKEAALLINNFKGLV
jgi:hypothetical protein